MDPVTGATTTTGAQAPLVETRIDGTQVLVGIFAEREAVERAINMLQAGGFDPHEISVVAREQPASERVAGQARELNRGSSVTTEPEAERMEGQLEADPERATSGTGVGLAAGAAAGAALGLAAFALPGVGALVAAGPIATVLAGTLMGAGAGAWAGSMAGIGVPQEDAARYLANLDLGQWLVAVRSNRVDEVLGIFHNAGALNV